VLTFAARIAPGDAKKHVNVLTDGLRLIQVAHKRIW
jgi:hypothetical protein